MRTRPAGLGRRAHPRSRGENRLDVLRHDQFAGSSPLTRGKRAPRTGGSCRGRLIPAHAGKTRTPNRWIVQGSAHPRSRGENPLTVAVMVAMPGSSPLTRGKLCRTLERVSDGGLIPAHAGKTCRTFSTCSSLPAHPRSRGENSATPVVKGEFKGSSPLTRGKRRPPTRG